MLILNIYIYIMNINKTIILNKRSNLDELGEHGMRVYKNNNFYRDLSNCMEHPEFRNFYNKYLKNKENEEVVLKFMNFYNRLIENTLDNDGNNNITSYHRVGFIDKVFDNTLTRDLILESNIDSIKLLN